MRYLKYLYCAAAGAILPCAFSPLKIWPLSILSPLVLLWAWNNSTPMQAFRWGFVYAFAVFAVGVGWIKACYLEVGYSQLVATLAMICFISILASYTGVIGFIVRKFYKNYSVRALCFGFPCLWVIFEWVRSWLFTGFPWLLMGYTQIDSPLKNYAPIVGVYGVSFLLLLTVSLVYIILNFNNKNHQQKYLATFFILVIWLGAYPLRIIKWTTLQNQEHTVSMIQTNLSPKIKLALNFVEHARVYWPITTNGIGSSFVIWPEVSVPYTIPYSQPLLDELDKIGKQFNTTFIIGAIYAIPESTEYYNSLVVLGNGHGIYNKQHLIPLWEYLPNKKYLGKILQYLKVEKPLIRPGIAGQNNIQVPNTTLLPLICYEIAFPDAVRRALLASKANAIVNISEDGWYVGTWAIGQNLDMVRMRALENGRYVIKSTTSGYSTIIDNKGNIIVISNMYRPQVISGVFKDANGLTPWTRLGADRLMILLAIIWLLSTINYRCFKKRER